MEVKNHVLLNKWILRYEDEKTTCGERNKCGRIVEFGYWVDERWVWDIPLRRNKVVFTGKEWNVGHCLELAKIRVAFWANVRWPNEYLLMIDVYIQPFEYSGPKQEKRGRKRITWDLQRMGEMKLNVDGTSTIDSNLAKRMAIKEALLIFIASIWKIERLKASLPSLEFRKIKKEAKQRAYGLAKNGAQQQMDILRTFE
ncbi:Uncharacterized protein TCM_028549 [Theobroma cacao]|uniref:Uncharacterized protein n=1 Tax=Theobroma cacao TaxID=3641 RepID=A0A061GB55_THECC|nr:Uncharacterized protein TCM_028549 [Theobroma cacao]